MTDAAVQKTTAAPGERFDFFDAHPRDRQRGLVLRVSGSRERDGAPRVTRTWAAMCRVRGSTKLRRFTIGDYPGIGLGAARERAAQIVGDARREGVDPVKQRKEATRQAEIASKDTVKAVAEAYLADLAKRPKTNGTMRAPRYIEETRRNFTNHVLPRWGAENIRDISRRDVNELLDAVRDGGSKVKGEDGERRTVPGGGIAANRTLAGIRSMFNYAIKRGIIAATPAAMVDRPGTERPRERTLTTDEIRAIWTAAEGMTYPFGPFFRLALMLGQRRNEIARMQWADIDLAEKVWTLPAEATKAARGHAVPLPPLAVETLQALPRKSCAANGSIRPSPYVFTTEGTRPISGFSKAKPALDRAIAKARDGEALTPWTIHDLRRTAATGMARLGATEFVIGRVLNHAAAGVTGKVYNQHDYLAEKRHALELWAAELSSLTAPRPGNVVELRSAAE
jgi:integrase